MSIIIVKDIEKKLQRESHQISAMKSHRRLFFVGYLTRCIKKPVLNRDFVYATNIFDGHYLVGVEKFNVIIMLLIMMVVASKNDPECV